MSLWAKTFANFKIVFSDWNAFFCNIDGPFTTKSLFSMDVQYRTISSPTGLLFSEIPGMNFVNWWSYLKTFKYECSVYLSWISRNSMRVYDIAKILQRAHRKLTLFWIESDSFHGQYFHNTRSVSLCSACVALKTQMSSMRHNIPGRLSKSWVICPI